MTAGRKLVLAAEIIGTYVTVRRRVRRAEFPAVLEKLRDAEPPYKSDAISPAALGRAVARTLSLLPFDSRCLMQSLVLTRLLARRGVAASVVIGVSPGSSFGAHAWVEAEGKPVLPARQHRFERLVAL